MPSLTLPTPTPSELDDLIYFSRVGELQELQDLVTQLCNTHGCAPSVLVASAIDVDADGLGSQASLLHYPAANGNLEIVRYLLSLLLPNHTNDTVVDKSAPQLVNHRNVSGNTPLHWAGMNGHLEIVKLLVAAGADPTVVNAAGRDAVVESECSAKDGAVECTEWMLKNCEGLERGVGGAQEEEGEAEEVEQGLADTTTDEPMGEHHQTVVKNVEETSRGEQT